MKTYNVKSIAALTGTNEETVRRWIRSGKLTSKGVSTIDGNIVSETDLISFFQKTPKYLTKAAQNVNNLFKNNPNEAAAYMALGVIGGGIALLAASMIDKSISSNEKKLAKEALLNDISQTKNVINDKQKMIEKIQKEIEEEQKYLNDLNNKIKEVENAK